MSYNELIKHVLEEENKSASKEEQKERSDKHNQNREFLTKSEDSKEIKIMPNYDRESTFDKTSM